jgi:glyoxylase-like metal-dependent hydrolase (beta-lactamase superfamily II)
LGDQTLIFDAFENPQASEDLLQSAVQLTHRKPATVIISHWHPDHWGGLQVFAGCVILATSATRQAMLPIAKEMVHDQLDPSRMEQELRDTEARLDAEIHPDQCHLLQVSIARQRYRLLALSTLQPTLPNQTFDGKIVFHGKSRTAELAATGKGHTESDCVLRLPKEKIAFIGDIGFFQSQPFMPSGFPLEWVTQLEEMAGEKTEVFVPGHGPVGGKADLVLEAKYIRTLENMVKEVIESGSNLKDALRQTLPPPFDAWQAVGHRFEANVRGSFKRQNQLVE